MDFRVCASFSCCLILMMRGRQPLPASRARLAAVLRASRELVSIDATYQVLALDRRAAAETHPRWLKQG